MEWYTDLCNDIMADGEIPTDWKRSDLVPVSSWYKLVPSCYPDLSSLFRIQSTYQLSIPSINAIFFRMFHNFVHFSLSNTFSKSTKRIARCHDPSSCHKAFSSLTLPHPFWNQTDFSGAIFLLFFASIFRIIFDACASMRLTALKLPHSKSVRFLFDQYQNCFARVIDLAILPLCTMLYTIQQFLQLLQISKTFYHFCRDIVNSSAAFVSHLLNCCPYFTF